MEPFRHEMMNMDNYDIVDDMIDSMMDIYDELDGAKKYILAAIKYKDENPRMAAKLVTMSAEEKAHAENIADGVEGMMAKAKSDGNPCYDVIHKVWVHIHARQDGYRAWIEQMHQQYKN